jgi:hypothetical protein
MQTVRGEIYAHGPYKSREGAEHRMETVQGGSVDVFKSWYGKDQAKEAIADYKNYVTERV